MSPLVVALEHGRTLVWVDNDRVWVTQRIPGAVERWEMWRLLGEETLPGLGGRVLTASERKRLTAPPVQSQHTEGDWYTR